MNLNRPLIKALATNATSAGFTAKTVLKSGDTPLGTNPSAASVAAVGLTLVAAPGGTGGYTPSLIRIYPYGLGADEDAFSIRLWGWWHLGSGPDLAKAWMPSLLGEFTCVLGSFAGYAGGPVLNTELFADTMGIVALDGEYTYTADVTRFGTVQLYTPANNTPACVQVPLRGAEYIEWDFDQTTNTPTMNALYQFFDEYNR